MKNLPLDVIQYINEFNSSTDGKALICTCKSYSKLKSEDDKKEIERYLIHGKDLHSAHKEDKFHTKIYDNFLQQNYLS